VLPFIVIARDLLLAAWIVTIAIAIYVAAPAAAIGRRARARLWPEVVAGAAWAVLITAVLVPPLARFHLFNWATSLLIVGVWPLALWIYRHRGAAAGARFKQMYRTLTLRVLTFGFDAPSIGVPAWMLGAVALLAPLFSRSIAELRLQSPADYQTLANARQLLAGGQWTIDPLAGLVAVLARVGAVDPMQVLRFLQPLLLCGAACAAALLVYCVSTSRVAALLLIAGVTALVIGGVIETPSTTLALGVTFSLAAMVLAVVAAEGLHERDRWHVLAAGLVSACVFLGSQPSAMDAPGHVEYDAAARVALRIAHNVPQGEWTIVGPREQRVEIARPDAYLDVGEFVRRYQARAGLRQFRFDLPSRNVFVFVEKHPLTVEQASLFPEAVGTSGGGYLPNTRARLQREALELCERYSRTHACASVYYEDDDLRVYQFCR
jgi:hypothetical protein